jgi:hypothetical protein
VGNFSNAEGSWIWLELVGVVGEQVFEADDWISRASSRAFFSVFTYGPPATSELASSSKGSWRKTSLMIRYHYWHNQAVKTSNSGVVIIHTAAAEAA